MAPGAPLDLLLLCSFSDFSFPLAHSTPATWDPCCLCLHGTLLTLGLCTAQPSAQMLMASFPTSLLPFLGSPLLRGAASDISVDTARRPQPPCSPCPLSPDMLFFSLNTPCTSSKILDSFPVLVGFILFILECKCQR